MKLQWEKVPGSWFCAQKARMNGFVFRVEKTARSKTYKLPWMMSLGTRKNVYVCQFKFDCIREAKAHCQRLADAMAAFGQEA